MSQRLLHKLHPATSKNQIRLPFAIQLLIGYVEKSRQGCNPEIHVKP